MYLSYETILKCSRLFGFPWKKLKPTGVWLTVMRARPSCWRSACRTWWRRAGWSARTSSRQHHTGRRLAITFTQLLLFATRPGHLYSLTTKKFVGNYVNLCMWKLITLFVLQVCLSSMVGSDLVLPIRIRFFPSGSGFFCTDPLLRPVHDKPVCISFFPLRSDSFYDDLFFPSRSGSLLGREN